MEADKNDTNLGVCTRRNCVQDLKEKQEQLEYCENELKHSKTLVAKLRDQQKTKDQEFLALKTAIKSTLVDSEKAILSLR
jgi:uncharacterized protein (DUF342 family)